LQKGTCRRVLVRMRPLCPGVLDMPAEDHIKLIDIVGMEIERCTQALAKAAYKLICNDWEELQQLRVLSAEVDEKVSRMNRTYLQEITNNRDLARNAKGVEGAMNAVEKSIEFYEPLQYLSDEARSACISIVGEKVKAIFDHDPTLQEKANASELQRFEETFMKDKLKAMERMNSTLRDEVRELRAAYKKHDSSSERLQWELSTAEADLKKLQSEATTNEEIMKSLRSQAEGLQASLKSIETELRELVKGKTRALNELQRMKDYLGSMGQVPPTMVDAEVQVTISTLSRKHQNGATAEIVFEADGQQARVEALTSTQTSVSMQSVVMPSMFSEEDLGHAYANPTLTRTISTQSIFDDLMPEEKEDSAAMKLELMVARQKSEELQKKVMDLTIQLDAEKTAAKLKSFAADEALRVKAAEVMELQRLLDEITGKAKALEESGAEAMLKVQREDTRKPTFTDWVKQVNNGNNESQSCSKDTEAELARERALRQDLEQRALELQAELKEEVERRMALEEAMCDSWEGKTKAQSKAVMLARQRAMGLVENNSLNLLTEQTQKAREQQAILKAQLNTVAAENQVLYEAMSEWQHEVPKVTKWLRLMGGEDKAAHLERALKKLEETIDSGKCTKPGMRLHLDAKLREVAKTQRTAFREFESDLSPTSGGASRWLVAPPDDSPVSTTAELPPLSPKTPLPRADQDKPVSPASPKRFHAHTGVVASFAMSGGVVPRVAAPNVLPPVSVATPRISTRDSGGSFSKKSPRSMQRSSADMGATSSNPEAPTSTGQRLLQRFAGTRGMEVERSGTLLAGSKGGFALLGGKV